ncbi:MAG: HAD hydrolase-like protein [Prevotellaceae bacterium]|nr:HAD hydrolase-like protein [Prevotellaceae bacterium]
MNRIIQNYIEKNGFEQLSPTTVLFDMDGVLYNSMPHHAIAWCECMKDAGLKMSKTDAYRYEGMRGVETIQLIARQQWNRSISEEKATEIYKKKCELYNSFPMAQQIDGVYELQEHIVHRGWNIGVVTGSGQTKLINRILEDFHGLVNPNIIVSAKDVSHGKPAPDPYIKGMQKANSEPWQTIVVENAPLGVRAAVAAKCFTIAVNTGPLPYQSLQEEGADLIVSSMSEAKKWIEETFS